MIINLTNLLCMEMYFYVAIVTELTERGVQEMANSVPFAEFWVHFKNQSKKSTETKLNCQL